MRIRVSLLLVSLLVGCGGSNAASGGTNDAGSEIGSTGEGGNTSDDGGSSSGDDAGMTGEGGTCVSSVTPAVGLVVTDRGPVQGKQETGTWAYLGIPYAAPPVGALRWAATQDHACWSTPLMATSFGSICLQVSSKDPTQVLGAEDCLTANVWSPSAATAASKLPVLVFIHGGSNVQGSSADTDTSGQLVYDGAALAAKANIVVVTFNYRLGALGFLAHPSFGANPGNYGTLDQLHALGWVQRNVASFGGDPTHVLVFGQSAGAEDTCNMVASPLAKGLFSAALMESGGCTGKTLSVAESFAQTWATKASCGTAADVASCLRAVDGNAVTLVMPEPADIAGSKQGDYEPDIDGVAMTGPSDQVIGSGAGNHVPFVIGSNSDETAQELAGEYPSGMTAAQYQAAVLAYASGNQTLANEVLAQYPVANYSSPLEAFVQVTTDAKFTDGARYAARMAVMGQPETPVWRYFYTHHLDGGSAATQALGAWHGQELVFVFQLMVTGYTPSAGELGLGTTIGGAWASMSATGAPVGGGVTWPPYVAATDPYTQLDDTVTTGTGVRTAQCDFWDMVLGR